MRPKNFVRTDNGKELAVLCLDIGYKLADKVSELTRHQINFLITAMNRRQRIGDIRARMADFGEGSTTFIFDD